MTAFVGWRRLVPLRLSKCFSVMTVTSACVSRCNVTGNVFTCNVTVGFDDLSPVTRCRAGRPLRLPQSPPLGGSCLGPGHSLKL